VGTELKADSIGLPTDLVAKYTLAPSDEDEPQSLDVLQALAAESALAGAVNTVVDLTERKREETLRESEQRFRMLADNMSQLAWTCDRLGNVTWYNKRWLDYTGLTFEDMKGWDWSKVQHPDHLDRVVSRVKRSAETGEPWEDTFPLRGKDGEYRWFLSRAMPIRDEEGNILQWFGTNTDVTEQKQAQEALRASEERFRRLFNSAPVAVFVCDCSGVIQDYNARAAELWGRHPVRGDPNETYCGSLRLRLPSGEVLPHDQSPIAEALRTGEACENVEVIIERPDGSQISVLVNFVPLTSAQGKVTGAITSFIDISERKQAQEQQHLLLREMNHRIKNLFALAGGVVTLSARSAETANDLAKAVSERLAALARAHELTLPGVTGEKADRPATLPVLVRAIISPLLVEKERVIINGPDVPISGNAVTSLALLLQEFATNAAKYGALASETGRIEISWCEWKGELLLAWREQGGPPIDGPPESEEEGFGSTLARLTVTGQLGGKISRDWNKEGLTVNLSIPLGRLAIT
jgi:PAS domain S-box-containing protein